MSGLRYRHQPHPRRWHTILSSNRSRSTAAFQRIGWDAARLDVSYTRWLLSVSNAPINNIWTLVSLSREHSLMPCSSCGHPLLRNLVFYFVYFLCVAFCSKQQIVTHSLLCCLQLPAAEKIKISHALLQRKLEWCPATDIPLHGKQEFSITRH